MTFGCGWFGFGYPGGSALGNRICGLPTFFREM